MQVFTNVNFTTAQNSVPDVEQPPQVVDVPLLNVQHEQLLVPPEELLPAEAAVDVLSAGFAVERVPTTLLCKTFYQRLREFTLGFTQTLTDKFAI